MEIYVSSKIMNRKFLSMVAKAKIEMIEVIQGETFDLWDEKFNWIWNFHTLQRRVKAAKRKTEIQQRARELILM